MKRFFALIIALLLLLCSCAGEVREDTTEIPEVTADVDILLSAAGFETLYDGELDATWVYRTDINSGFFTRILVYKDGKTSLRLICTDADSFEYNGKTYDIESGDTSADADLTDILRKIAGGESCRVGGREITDKERAALDSVIKLCDASYGASNTAETKPEKTAPETDEEGNRIFDNGSFSIKYPASFEAVYDNGSLTLVSGEGKQRTVSVLYVKTKFSPSLADKDAARMSVTEQGGKLISEISETTLSGKTAYKYKYELDGVFITQYFADGGEGTYILTAGTYEISDLIPDNVISTFKIKQEAE